MKYTYRNQKIRDSAKDENCTMFSPQCNNDPRTTVFCHSNMLIHGRGTSRKAWDIFGFYGCSGCHNWYDKSGAPRTELENHFWPAFSRTLMKLIEKGIVK